MEQRGRFDLSDVARIGVFAALSFGVNAPFLAIPNVETFTLALFLSGVFLGVSRGIAVAFIAGIIFVFFNPNGPQTVILVGIAQLLGFILFGLVGGLLRSQVLKKSNLKWTLLLLLLSGATLTLWYDLSTNLAFALIFGPFWPVLIGGLGFGLIHFISNTIIFGLSSLIVGKIWKRIEYIMPPLAG
jgi:hypothetical protein